MPRQALGLLAATGTSRSCPLLKSRWSRDLEEKHREVTQAYRVQRRLVQVVQPGREARVGLQDQPAQRVPSLLFHRWVLALLESRRGQWDRRTSRSRWPNRAYLTFFTSGTLFAWGACGANRTRRTNRSRGSYLTFFTGGAFFTSGALLTLRACGADGARRTSFSTRSRGTTFAASARGSDLSLGTSWTHGARFARVTLWPHRSRHSRWGLVGLVRPAVLLVQVGLLAQAARVALAPALVPSKKRQKPTAGLWRKLEKHACETTPRGAVARGLDASG